LVVVRLIRVGLSAIRAATARVGGFPLLAILVYVADEYPAANACVGALEAGIVRLYGVVVILDGWVRWVRGRLIRVNLLVRLAGAGECLGHSPGSIITS
jgi:hypothetical protein